MTDSTAEKRRALWLNLSFLLMWTSVAASGFGDRLIMLAAQPMLGSNIDGVSVARITAGISFSFFAPYLVLTIVGGWLADRVPRKFILFACDWGRALVLLFAWWWMGRMTEVVVPDAEHWRVYAIIAGTGALAAVFNPARFAVIPQLVPGYQLQSANAILAAIALVASLIGQKVGAVMIGDDVNTDALRFAVLVGVGCYVVSGPFFLFMKVRRSEPKACAVDQRLSVLRQIAMAFAYLRGHRAVRQLVILNVLFWACAWVLYAALAALVKMHYGLPANEYVMHVSNMLVALGLGMLCASIVVMLVVASKRESDIVAMTSLMLAAVCMLVLTFNRIYWLGLTLTFLSGLFGGCFLILVDTLTQSLTPNYVRGRVFGLRSTLNTTGTVIVNALIWTLPESKAVDLTDAEAPAAASAEALKAAADSSAAAPWLTADNVILVMLGCTALLLLVVSARAVCRLFTAGRMSRMQNTLWHIVRVYMLNWHRLKWIDRHHIPASGRILLAANHTTGTDPFLIQSACPRLVRWVMLGSYRFKVLNFMWKAINPIIVEQDGNDLAATRQMLRELKVEHTIVGIFPEGTLQRNVRELKPFESGVGFLARKSKVTVLPVWIAGSPRQKHMLWHFVIPSRSIVLFGEPYLPDPSQSNAEIAEELRQRMIALQDKARAMGHH